MRCLLLSPDFRQFHLVKRFPYRSSFPPLHFIGYQGARNRAREAVKRCNAGSLLNTGSSGDLTELNHGSQTATGRRRPIKVTDFPLRVRSVSSNGSWVEYANVCACMYVCALGILPCDPGAERVVSSLAHPAHSGVSSLTDYLCLHLTSSC